MYCNAESILLFDKSTLYATLVTADADDFKVKLTLPPCLIAIQTWVKNFFISSNSESIYSKNSFIESFLVSI